jgi:alkylhydroperoxidase family enzyme
VSNWSVLPISKAHCLFNEQERAVMRCAAEATREVEVSDATFDALRGFLDNRRIMELAMNVAFYNAV